MKKETKQVNLQSSLIGGIIFLGVFMLNVVLFIQSGEKGISIDALKAYALTGGTNNEEENTGYDSQNKQTTTKSDTCVAAGGKKGKYTITTVKITCVGSGVTDCTASESKSVSGCVANE